MGKITLTGASGFVGKNLVDFFLKNNYEFYDLSLRNSDWHNNFPNDGLAIIHLAGKAHDTSNNSNPDEYYKINRDLTIRLFQKFLLSEICDFFYFSSVKAVADTVSGELSEDVIGEPLTPYGKSKFEAEQFLLSQSLPKGKRLFIIRPCMIHGPGNKGNLNLLYKVVEKGIPWPLASFINERSFLSVDNLCYIVSQMINDKTVPSGIYNFADDMPLSTNDLVNLISDCLGKRRKLWHINPNVIKSIVRIGDVFNLPLNSERLKKLTESYNVSNKKIKAVLDIDQLPISAIEGLEKTIKSFRENNG